MPTTVGAFTQAAIETAITTASSGDGKVYCPGGTYVISTGLNIINKAGLEIYGDAPYVPGLTTSNPSYACMWKWDGPLGGTMFRLNGHRCKIRNICFHGNAYVGFTSTPTGTGAGIGLLLAAESGWACGYNVLEDVIFYNYRWNASGEDNTLGVGLQMGESSGDANCADNRIIRPLFWAVGTCIKTVNDQAVNNTIYDPDFLFVNTALDIVRGGKLRVYSPSMIGSDTLLKVTQAGPNTGYYFIHDASVEPWGFSQKYSVAVDAASAADVARIVIDGYQEGGRDAQSDGYADNNATRFKIGANVQLTTRNCFLKTNGWPIKAGAGKWVSEHDAIEDDVLTNADLGSGRGVLVQDSGEVTLWRTPRQTSDLQLWEPGAMASPEANQCTVSFYVMDMHDVPVVGYDVEIAVQQGDNTAGIGILGSAETLTSDATGLISCGVRRGYRFTVKGASGKWRQFVAPNAATYTLPQLIV